MHILINCSNLHNGGGVSVATSFLEYLSLMPVVVHGVNGENIFSENLKTTPSMNIPPDGVQASA